jgi:acetyl esterase/lipase
MVHRQILLVAGSLGQVVHRRVRRGPARPGWSLRTELAVHVLRSGMARAVAEGPVGLRAYVETLLPPATALRRVTRREDRVGGVPVVRLAPRRRAAERTILYIHGGGYVFGSPTTHGDLAARLAIDAHAEVVLVDYRLAPEHPYPAAWNDVHAAYCGLLDGGVDPARLIVAGDSAGGGLTLSLLKRLRDERGALPAGAVLISPWLDPSARGGSLDDNLAYDWLTKAFESLSEHFAVDVPLDHPHIAPMHGDLAGLPPLLVQCGGAELFVDQVRRFVARAAEAGLDVEYDEAPDMVHVWHLLAVVVPEGRAAIRRVAAFARERVRSARDPKQGVAA